MNSIRILGIRGIPAAHGGFETFAEYLSVYLKDRDWKVTVYCQEEGSGDYWEDDWCGVRRIHIPVKQAGPLGTIVFDLKSTIHAAKAKESCLTLGYNTAVFTSLLRIAGIKNVINMDGIEWSRAKWGPLAKTWFWMNDWAGCWLGNHLVADHPEIKNHLRTRVADTKITTIAYGAEQIDSGDKSALEKFHLEPNQFLTLIARAEPENSILEVVKGFSAKPRGVKLVVLGNYDRSHAYQEAVLSSASDEVIFIGAIYEKSVVQSLRHYSLAYIHGHQVGGTNPSLVEALGAGNAVIAHDNRFNRWVAADSAVYFGDASEFANALEVVLGEPEKVRAMKDSSRHRFQSEFTWPHILSQYEGLLKRFN